MSPPKEAPRRWPRRWPHAATGRLFCWVYCVKCGLVYLRNEATARSIQAGCREKE